MLKILRINNRNTYIYVYISPWILLIFFSKKKKYKFWKNVNEKYDEK